MTRPHQEPTALRPPAASPASIRVQRRVEWSDTDASGYYHNTLAFRLVEVAETALFDRLGILDQVYGRLPRVHISADFHIGLRHRDLLDVTLDVEEIRRSSITYRFRIERGGEVAVEGTAVAALLDRAGGRPVPWPEDHRRLLLTAGPQPPELLATG